MKTASAICLLALLSGILHGAPPARIPNTAMPKPQVSFWFEDSDEGVEIMKRHQVSVNGKPAQPPTVSVWGGRISWVVPTPKGGDYFVSLHMVSGEERPGKFGYAVGKTEHVTPEFREKGKFTGTLRTYRISIPKGQTETSMFLEGKGIYLGRVDLASAPETLENPNGRIHTLAPSSYRTVLKSASGKPGAVVLLPPNGNPAREQAQNLAKKLGLPTMPELSPTHPFPAYPVAGASPDTNLIVLSVGRGGPLAQALHRAQIVETNHANPGAGGYVIRTLARPFRGTANVIFFGTSDGDGLAKATALFAPKHDPETGDTIYDTFLTQAPSATWSKLRNSYTYTAMSDSEVAHWMKRLEQPYAGYKNGTVARAFISRTAIWADRYYRSGDVRSAEICKRFLFKMEDEGIYGGSSQNKDSHMALYHLMRGWDRVEEAPCFSASDRLRIVNFLLLHCLEGDEGYARSYSGYRSYSGKVRMRHNHQTILGRGMMLGYLYYSRLYNLGRADMWKSWCDSLIRNGTYWGHAPEDSPNYEPGTFLEVRDMLHYQGLSTKGHEGTHAWLDTALRFAAGRDAFGLPSCYGDCWDVMDYGRLDFFKMMRDDWDWPGAQAVLDHAIRGYRHVLAPDNPQVPSTSPARPSFAYTDGSTEVGGLLPAPTAEEVANALRPITGLVAVPMPRGYYDYMAGKVGHTGLWEKRGRPPVPPHEKTADKVVYRSGWTPKDEYLMIEGLGWANHGHMDLGTLVQYCRDGRLWIVDGGYENLQVRHHSTLDLKRDGQPGWRQYGDAQGRWGDFRDGPQMLEVVSLKPDKPGKAGPFEVVLRARDYAGATWVRTVSGGGGQALTVVDEITAEKAGNFDATVRYRFLGDVEGSGASLRVIQKGAELPVRLATEPTDSVGLATWEPDGHTFRQGRYPFYAFLPPADAALPPKSKQKGIPKTVEWSRKRNLKPGEKMVFRAVLGPPEAK